MGTPLLDHRPYLKARTGEYWRKHQEMIHLLDLVPTLPGMLGELGFIRLRRILVDIRRTRRQDELLPRILVPIFLALLAGAWGEMLGYVLGGGDCARRKAPVELQRERFLSKGDPWSKERIQAPED